MIDKELERLINTVFDEWTCKKKRISPSLAHFYTTTAKDKTYQLKCCKATNPITNETRFMGVHVSIYGTLDLVGYGYLLYEKQIYHDIVVNAIKELFKVSTKKNKYKRCMHTMERGRQFNEMLENARKEIMSILGAYPKDLYYDEDDFFFTTVMNYDYDSECKKFKRPIYGNSDAISTTLSKNYEPFESQTDALEKLLWKMLKPQMVRYEESEIYMDLKNASEGYIEFDSRNKNVIPLIINYCKDKEKFTRLLDTSMAFCKKLKEYQKNAAHGEHIRLCELIKMENSYSSMVSCMKHYANVYDYKRLAETIYELLDFEEP